MDKPTAFEKVMEHDGGMRFADMTRLQKCVFVTKVVVCVATFGYVFPHVQSG
jgi:hypothetical protein